MRNKILQLLTESGEFISGQEMSDRFNVSRTAVWKAIRSLEEEGYEIEAVRNKGYRLAGVPELMSEKRLFKENLGNWPGAKLCYYEETDSTNNRIDELAGSGAPEGTVAVAEEQTKGKGRRGRVWKSPKGSGLYFSVLLRPEIPPHKASMLTLVKALAVAEALRNLYGLEVQIKWPNDVVVNGRKICGILTEMKMEDVYIRHIIVGTGINVNIEVFPEEIRETATSLYLELGHKVDRIELLGEVMRNLEKAYRQVVEAESLLPVLEDYNKYLVNRGRRVRVLDPAGEYEAQALFVNESGELIVETDDKEVKHVYAGEVSVRGVYGYV